MKRPTPALGATSFEDALSGDGERTLAEDVLDGLTRPFKELPPKYVYDSRGSALFDRICELPEYYPTRTERSILERDGRRTDRSDRRQRARRARFGERRQRRGCCSTRWRRPARCSGSLPST